MSYTLGIDIGGRSAELALVTRDGQLIERIKVPTADRHDPALFLAPLFGAVSRLFTVTAADGQPITGIGVGVPGLVDFERGEIEYVTNLPVLQGLPLRAELSRRFGVPVVIDNDVNCAALGEALFGQGRGVGRCLTVAIGTGVGAGMVVDGQVVRVSHGGIGDPGHVIVDPDAQDPCPCGGRGCLEGMVAAPALERRAASLARSQGGLLADRLANEGAVAAVDVSAAAIEGDPAALQLFADAGRWLGLGLVSLCHIFTPQRIVLCGGVAQAGELLLAPARAAVQAYGMPVLVSELEIVISERPTAAGVIGAAAAAALLHNED